MKAHNLLTEWKKSTYFEKQRCEMPWTLLFPAVKSVSVISIIYELSCIRLTLLYEAKAFPGHISRVKRNVILLKWILIN